MAIPDHDSFPSDRLWSQQRQAGTLGESEARSAVEVEKAEELRETRMVDREEIELTWRKEFDELGESGVHHEFFRSAYLSDQRKEGFAYRWLGEKRKVEERTNRRRWRNIRGALKILVILTVIAGALLHNSSCERIHAFLTRALPDPDGFRHPNARHSIQRGALRHTFHVLIIRSSSGQEPAKQCLES